ncbi:DUF134 domain-containing protein [Oryzomonas japonica]|uniref:DUF134 domain-containing protein n=1 Tax=Oryzomonas japonica TaxID=2603858 RepID=A0A7J4ZPY6_9BACT|nr:DUF134 domain-containing protein [Oryzomonas japonica]KAB0665052.1 DUF134 domain-containing protein [Oryzomonas japonica]
MSPRTKKPRICTCPLRAEYEQVFKPAGTPLGQLEQVVLHNDELEALYLCDGERLQQEEAGMRMGVSRGTVQRLLASARAKVVQALVGNKALCIK